MQSYPYTIILLPFVKVGCTIGSVAVAELPYDYVGPHIPQKTTNKTRREVRELRVVH